MITNIYETDSHQMRTCDTCDMPNAIATTDNLFPFSLLKHVIIESRACRNNPEVVELLKLRHEAQGTLSVFDAAQKCMRCAVGLCLIINGNETNWNIGGETTPNS